MKPDITIFCLTYNHVQYIRDAFEGFLNQKMQFTFNVFVYDDASTDGTSDIVREYRDKYPDLFQVYISEKNLYRAPNREAIMMELYEKYIQGKYVAWCEGDDYWTDPNKLQLQVQYMEEHPECSMTAHGAVWMDCQNNKKKDYLPFGAEKDLTAEEIILQPTGNLSTASLVMHREIFMRDANYPRCRVMDRPLQMYALCYGKIHFFPQVMCVYRYMHKGSWSVELHSDFKNSMTHCYDMIAFLQKYNSYTNMRYNEYIRKNIITYLYFGVYSCLDMRGEEYREKCKELDISTGGIYQKYLEGQCGVLEWMNGSYIFDDSEKQQLESFGHIVVMGTGEYSKYVKKIFENNHLSFEGYVVSTIEGEATKEKPIWELKRYPYEKESTLIVVAIHQQSEQSVLESLRKYNFSNYVTPLWVCHDAANN